MNTEQIKSQERARAQRIERENQRIIKNELKREEELRIERQKQNDKMPPPPKVKYFEESNIQRLISEQAQQTKKEIMRSSHNNMMKTLEMNEALQETLNEQIEEYFKNDSKFEDEVTLSKNYKEREVPKQPEKTKQDYKPIEKEPPKPERQPEPKKEPIREKASTEPKRPEREPENKTKVKEPVTEKKPEPIREKILPEPKQVQKQEPKEKPVVEQKPIPKKSEDPKQVQQQEPKEAQKEPTQKPNVKESVQQAKDSEALLNSKLADAKLKDIQKQYQQKPKNIDQEVAKNKFIEQTPNPVLENKPKKLTTENNVGAASWVNHEEDPDELSQIKRLYQAKNNVNQDSKSDQAQPQQQAMIAQQDVKHFAQLVSQYAINKNPETKREIERQKKILIEKGIELKEIDHMTSRVGQLIKQHMAYDLKQQLIKVHMTKGFSKHEHTHSSMEFNQSSKELTDLRKDGKLTSPLRGVIENLKHQAKQDLGNFLYEESVNKFIKHSLNQLSLEEFTKDLLKLQQAAASAGIEISEKDLTDKITAAIDHLGLSEFTLNKDSDQQNQQNQATRILTPEETLDDKLRYLYMMKALHPSLRKQIEINFKMKKCKNGMIKLGFFTQEKDDDLKKQGNFLAAEQFREELSFAFREEATMANLDSTEHAVLRKKKAFYQAQLTKTGYEMKDEEIEQLKNNMYREMYGLIKEEILQLEELMEVHSHISITRKLKHLKEVARRITEDAIIFDNIGNQKSIKEPIVSKIREAA